MKNGKTMKEKLDKERTLKDFFRDLLILLLPFALVYTIYVLFIK
jgi:hypothetical protein